MIWIVKVIGYEGKSKVTEYEEIEADFFEHDDNNNLIFYNFADEEDIFIKEYHCYNWISVELKKEET